ncbi:MAG TPA: PEP/pyruvate-binding domain-containing protein [Anaerolineae bacterium]|nr:PEP/pyruvate-binding domain-containing protein [Anaerolineae bacterium]
MTDYIKAFDSITAMDVPVVGGKGANLGEMTRAGLPVPPGFCLTADAYRTFIANAHASETIGTILAQANLENAEDVEAKTVQVRAFLIAQPIPETIESQLRAAYAELAQKLQVGAGELPVAVRSSATAEDLPDASFAGQQDTYLNIRGTIALLEHVKRCWASLWTARAVTYREKQHYAHEQVALAVVVQAMIESEVAGVLFTVNPVNQHRDEMVLNASWGLGEAIVSGLVTPDTWIVRKDGEILEREIASKDVAVEYAEIGGTREVSVPAEKRNIPSLNDGQVQALVTLGEKVERHYARPMDIEWAFAREQFYMLQARPITTLSAGDTAPKRAALARGEATSPLQNAAGEYNRSMFIEIFPDPLSPAFLSVIEPLFQSMLDFTFKSLGFKPPANIPAIGVFYNQPYFHLEYIEAALAPLSPSVRDALVMQILNPFGKHKRTFSAEASPVFLGMVTRLLRFMTAFPKKLPGLIASYRAEINHLNTLPLETLSEAEIIARVRRTVFEHASHLLNYDFLMIALIGITYQMLGSLLDRYFRDESEQVRAKLISGVTGNVTMETNKKLWGLAQEAKSSAAVKQILKASTDAHVREQLSATGDGRVFLAELDAFLEQYGHREVRMDILYPTWSEDPAPVLQFIRGYFDADEAASPRNQQARLVRERQQLAQTVDERVRRDLSGRIAIAPLFHWVLKHTQANTRERDTMHFELTRLFPPLRRALLELAARWQKQNVLDSPDDIFFLTLDEMSDIAQQAPANRPRMQNVINARRAEFQANAQRTPPPILREGIAIETTNVTVDEQVEGQWRGIAGSPGIATGTVRVIRGPEEFEKLQRGEILVAPLTNPVWTPLFAIAGGIITQVGGILSHGAIVAREYGIPAVMAVPNAMTIFQDGQRVTVDGNRGIVSLEL